MFGQISDSNLSLIISGVSAVLLAWIAYRHARLQSEIAAVRKATDGLTTKLADAKLAQGTAEGRVQGREESHATPPVLVTDKVEVTGKSVVVKSEEEAS